MKMNEKKRLPWRVLVLAAPMAGALLLFFMRDYIVNWAQQFPPCPFYRLFHLYCPACGNTRSILALLRLDIVGSLRYNVMPVLLLAFGALCYVELAAWVFGKRVRIVPRSNAFLFGCIGALLMYFVVRNFWI